jgi:hypothetical protein
MLEKVFQHKIGTFYLSEIDYDRLMELVKNGPSKKKTDSTTLK